MKLNPHGRYYLDAELLVQSLRDHNELTTEKRLVSFSQSKAKWTAKFANAYAVITLTGDVQTAREFIDPKSVFGPTEARS